MRVLYLLAVRWYDDRKDRRARARQMALFPVGTRVRAGGCACARDVAGLIGSVTGPTSMLTDWWVRFPGGVDEILCARGMERVEQGEPA